MFLRSLASAAVAVIVSLAPAAAATWQITFFEANLPVLGDDPSIFDFADDGIADGTGSFVAVDAQPLPLILSLTATVNGQSFGTTVGVEGRQFSLPSPGTDYAQGVWGLTGSPNPATYLRLGTQGLDLLTLGTSFFTYGTWGIGFCTLGPAAQASNCEGQIATQGYYRLTRVPDPEPPVVPLPASAALLPLGLGALALLRRRRARAA